MKIHPKCNYYCPRCGSMINETFQSDFYMREYSTESNTARYLIPRRDLVVCFFVKIFYCFSSLFLLVLPSLSKESNILYADEHRISHDLSILLNILTFRIYWSFIQEIKVEKFSHTKDVNNSFTTIIYIICYVLSGLFFDVITLFYFNTNSISTARFKEKAAV